MRKNGFSSLRWRSWRCCSLPSSAAKSCCTCGIGCCRRSSASARSISGKPWDFCCCAASCSADWNGTVITVAPVSAVAWKGAVGTRRRKSANDSGNECVNASASARTPARTRANKAFAGISYQTATDFLGVNPICFTLGVLMRISEHFAISVLTSFLSANPALAQKQLAQSPRILSAKSVQTSTIKLVRMQSEKRPWRS